jgi:hypothetical protein
MWKNSKPYSTEAKTGKNSRPPIRQIFRPGAHIVAFTNRRISTKMVVHRSLLFAHQWTRTHQFVMISSQSALIGFAFDQAKRPRPAFMIRFAAQVCKYCCSICAARRLFNYARARVLISSARRAQPFSLPFIYATRAVRPKGQNSHSHAWWKQMGRIAAALICRPAFDVY